MKKTLSFAVAVAVLGLAACKSNKKTDKEIDSLNKASADSLLNAALADTSNTKDSITMDSLKLDSVKIK